MIEKIVEAFKNSDFDDIVDLVKRGLEDNLDPLVILNDGLIIGIREVGEQFRRGEVYLPEMILG